MAIRKGYDRRGGRRAGFGGSGSHKVATVRPGKSTNRSNGRGAAVLAKRSHASLNVGRGRGIIGPGTADLYGRLPVQQKAKGNYGGGYAGVGYGKGRHPNGAKRRG